MTNTMWMVRSASGGRLADAYREKGVVAIGWVDIGDLTRFKDKKAIISAIEGKWPEWKPGRVMSSASQLIRRFIGTQRIGNLLEGRGKD